VAHGGQKLTFEQIGRLRTFFGQGQGRLAFAQTLLGGLAAQHFGAAKGPIVFGWAFASHQLGGAVAALGAGVSRDALATYVPAFFAAGLACMFATIAIFGLRKFRAAAVTA
jgi:hypothetical protein